MADADKPKTEESEAAKAEEKPKAEESKAAESEKRKEATGSEPEAKRLKPTPPDKAVVKKQVEYYLSDENLKYDKFFHEKIAADKEGWLEMQLILSCNKMKVMRATKDDVIASLKESKIEINATGDKLRRPGGAPLPKLEARPSHQKKSSIHVHDGGVVAIFKSVPAEQQWTHIKQAVQDKLPPKVNLWHVGKVDDKSECALACAPFDGDIAFFEELEIEVGGAKLKCETCFGESLQKVLKDMPKMIRDKRERESRKRQKERNRPIKLGTSHFNNVAMLRGRVKEILNARSDGEQLKPDGSDFKLIKSLLQFHPAGDAKSKGLVGIKVAKSQQGDSRCFYMIKEDGKEEDFSAKKCLDAVELNPPYVQVEEKKTEAKASAKPAADGAKKEEAKTETKAADAEKKVEGGDPKTEEIKAEEKAAEPNKEEDKKEEKPTA
eukprot:TRINITY_DN401_c0_g1_i1.p1 TRINITY_DN401_c0_g1~~TRINITY_DN401_c0_g1_i1.p1  ORF type:complete len:455 (+),score=137.89 TRINITY_DN401_c0_g1_i1:55-1365(+)